MTVVVTGASGHIGANLVRMLLERGRSVRALIHDDSRGLEGLEGLATVTGDVRDAESLARAFDGAESVFHLAAHISIEGDRDRKLEAVNVHGTRNVVDACLKTGVRRLVHFSSVHALRQEPQDEDFDEKRPFLAHHEGIAYDRSKSAAEKEVLAGVERGLDAVLLNPSGVLGPHDYHGSAMGEVLLRIGRGALPALVPGGFHWVDVRDVCQAACAAEKRARAGERYILAGEWATIGELSRMAEEVTGVPPPRLNVPLWLARVAAPAATLFCRISGSRPLFTADSLEVVIHGNRRMRHEKAGRELGFAPRPLRETIHDTYEWFNERGLLGAQGRNAD